MNSKVDSFDQFDFVRNIGKGSYGEVSLGRHKRDRKQYVLKKINLKKASKRERKSAEQEAKLLSKLKHPNIVSYKDSFEKDGYLYIAMQYCEGGDLYHHLKEQKNAPLEERKVVEWFVQIAMALQYMHERNILHRDLKTQNIFLTKSKIIKVGDLGIARVLESSTDMATTLIGTPYYMSPELFSNKPYNHKSDVWALGCCVYEMTTLKHAFNAKDMNSLVYKILKGKMPAMPKQYGNQLVQLIKSMLHQDPNKRPSVNKLLRDPYIKENIAIFLEETKQNRRPSSASRSRPSSSSVRSLPVNGYIRPPSSSAQRPPPVVSQPSKSVTAVSDRDKKSTEDKPLPSSHNRNLQPVQNSRQSSNEPQNYKQQSSESQGYRPPTKETQNNRQPPIELYNRHSSNEPQNYKKLPIEQRQPKVTAKNEEINPEVKVESSDSDTTDSTKPVSVKHPEPVKKPRPLPPPPKVKGSDGLPQKRGLEFPQKKQLKSVEGSNSSSSSKDDNIPSSKDYGDIPLGDETPRSLPNVSARDRRRKKNGQSMDNPQSARIRLRPQPVEAVKSKSVPKSSISAAKALKQPSIQDSSSSEEDPVKNTDEKQRKRENKEMNNFISLLDTTLNMNKSDEKSDDEEVAGPSPNIEVEVEDETDERIQQRISSIPSVETLCNSDRLMTRIQHLYKDCIKGVGHEILLKACELLTKIEEDDIEPKLVELLGKDKFDDYAGKIWQLKFCEDQAALITAT
ncbi:hypothetical protein ScPMuIL_009003 [Solemya velum]